MQEGIDAQFFSPCPHTPLHTPATARAGVQLQVLALPLSLISGSSASTGSGSSGSGSAATVRLPVPVATAHWQCTECRASVPACQQVRLFALLSYLVVER